MTVSLIRPRKLINLQNRQLKTKRDRPETTGTAQLDRQRARPSAPASSLMWRGGIRRRPAEQKILFAKPLNMTRSMSL